MAGLPRDGQAGFSVKRGFILLMLHLHIVSSVSGHDVHRQYPEIVVDAIEYVMRQVSAIDDED
jgi:hypothetical protein